MFTLPGHDSEGNAVEYRVPTLGAFLGLAAICLLWVGAFLSLASYLMVDRVDPVVVACTVILGLHRTALGTSKIRERAAAEVASPVLIGRQRTSVRLALISSAAVAGGAVGALMSRLGGAAPQTMLLIAALIAAWEVAYVLRQGPVAAGGGRRSR